MSGNKDSDMNSIVLVASGSESDNDNSITFEGPSHPLNPRKRLREEDKNDYRNKFYGVENLLLDKLTDISESISKMVPIQGDIMKSMKNISNRLDNVVDALQTHLKKEAENQVEAVHEVNKKEPQINSEKESPASKSDKKMGEQNVRKLANRKSKKSTK